MKKVIPGLVNFPNGCETVRFTACLASMLLGAEGTPEQHERLYHLYTAVTGFGFLQMDLSDDAHMQADWNQTCNVMLRTLDWYIGFAFDYAGYEFDELIFRQEDRAACFGRIKASIDRGAPVLALFGRLYQWVLITGYDDEGTLYGLDGSRGYWGAPTPKPAGYDEDGLFIMPNWHELGGHAFILGEKKPATLTLRDAFVRGIRIMERMHEGQYYRRSVAFVLDDKNFEGLDGGQLLGMRRRIVDWIGQPMDLRAMIGYATEPARLEGLSEGERIALAQVHRLCAASHDVLWVAWHALGEYMDGDALVWAKGLEQPVVRKVIADCISMVANNDEQMLCVLREGFGGGA